MTSIGFQSIPLNMKFDMAVIRNDDKIFEIQSELTAFNGQSYYLFLN